MTLFKIRNPQGLFSTGGTTPSWSKRGKTWVALNHVNAHLTLVRSEKTRWIEGLKDERTKARFDATRRCTRVDKTIHPYVGCVVVEFEATETGCRGIEI
jgi:hypothetical protein